MNDAESGVPAEAPVPTICVLGAVDLRNVAPGDADRLLSQSKVVGLLLFLALAAPGRHQRRDRAAAMLWPELDQAHARAALRKAVLAVRSVLGKDALVGRGDEELLLPPERLRCDAVEFAVAADNGQLARALELYRGDLAPGFHLTGCAEFGVWLDEQRALLHERAAGAAWAMARRLEADRHYTHATDMARLSVRYAWTDERVLRRAMLMLQRLDDRTGALRLFEDVSRRLRLEMETEPSAETVQLAMVIRKA